MDLPKFIAMLATGGLWFSKAATFNDDPFEGFCVATALEVPPSDDSPKVFLQKDATGSKYISVAEFNAHFSRSSAEVCEGAREHLYVNSWCLGPESMAMWEIYGSKGYGVAVTSSVGQYQRAAKIGIIRMEQFAFGKVKYHDDIEASPEVRRDFSERWFPPGPGLWPEVLKLGFHKRSCFTYENEWRAALYQDDRPERGVGINFDLVALINGIYVGPRAESLFFDVVASIMEKFSLSKPLQRSTLLCSPRRQTVTA
jgi:Protein of unknown function (DUF2971)